MDVTKLELVPKELRALSNWVCWKLERRGDKLTKVPVNAKTGREAKSNDPTTWVGFDAALHALKNGSRCEGVGFMIAPPYVGIDLDGYCDSAGEISDPKAREIVRLVNSYTEYSPSGTGVHIWLRGTLPPGRRKVSGTRDGRKIGIEMYDTARYFTVTGRRVPGTPAEIRELSDDAMAALHLFGFGDEKFCDLWLGDWRKYERYTSQSEADLAFCSMLARQISDPAKIDAIFRASHLYRNKWDEHRGSETYGQITINRALSGLTSEQNNVVEIVGPTIVAPVDAAPAYPREILEGDLIGELTRCLTDGTPIPPQYVREQVKTVLGAIVDGKVGYANHVDLHTREYAILISNYPESGKSESWKRTGARGTGHLHPLLEEFKIKVLDGGLFGSGQYAARVLSASDSEDGPAYPGHMAYFDEMSELFEKNRQEGSTLEILLLKAFDGNSVATGSFKNKQYVADDVHLSISGNFTRDSLERALQGRGAAGSGFLSRCVLAYGDRLPHKGDWAEVNWMVVEKIIPEIVLCIPATAERFIPPEDPEAAQARHDFETAVSEDATLTRYAPRITSHVKRDALMRAVFSKERRVTKQFMEKAIKWGWHQLELRQLLWPEDAGSVVEIMERKIMNALQKYGPQSNRDLIRRCNVNRPRSGGHEVFGRALKALVFNGVIHVVEQTRKLTPVYALVA